MSPALLATIANGGAAPFGPSSVAGFAAWYRYDAGPRFQDAGKTTPATTGNLCRVISPFSGSGPDLEAPDDANRFTIDAGGLLGDGTKTGYASAGWNFSTPYTVFVCHKVGTFVATVRYYGGIYYNTAARTSLWRLDGGNALCYYDTDDAAVVPLLGTSGQYQTVGIKVAANSGTLWRVNGTLVSADGSSGNTGMDANTTITLGGGAGVFGGNPCDTDMMPTDLIVYNAAVSDADGVRILDFLNTLR